MSTSAQGHQPAAPANSEFQRRHIGPSSADESVMLATLGVSSRAELMAQVLPQGLARTDTMDMPPPVSEAEALAELERLANLNQIHRSFIGQGYFPCHTPGVILRNILENPAWYTAYTPYQAEISQGRLEALINFQTLVCDLTGMPIANASMLDEATAAAEAMTLARRSVKAPGQTIVVSTECHPQTLEVIETRAEPLGLQVRRVPPGQAWEAALAQDDYFAVLLQYPGTSGDIVDLRASAQQAHAQGAALIVAADLLALTLLTPPGELGADLVVGTTQRLGMPMGAGGPHAAYLACQEAYKRSMPGRLVGVSVDAQGRPAYRLALQTREQHIRREKATSNICTAQVLPAVVASMYAVYHGPEGLKAIAQRIAHHTAVLASGLTHMGHRLRHEHAFDTVCLEFSDAATADHLQAQGWLARMNLRRWDAQCLCISLDETTTPDDVHRLWALLATDGQNIPAYDEHAHATARLPQALLRTSSFLTHPVFHQHRSETAMLRYIRKLSDQDLALDRSMIPLGSCTMKLNATSEMIPITWPQFANLHPYAPFDQQQGYALLDQQLRDWLCAATGYADISLQPNAGSQGEYAGLLAIRAWHRSRGQAQRNICLIPESAHGTNPASAQMVGMRVVAVKCDAQGNVDLDDLRVQCERHSEQLAAIMITYPSTHGVFEPGVRALCETVHAHGGRVYVDGANLNALVGLAAPGAFGGDVSHLNLHKTFCIPHGGGGPGVGPVCVVEDLVPHLPGHATTGIPSEGVGAVSAAPLGNASVLPISWMYVRLMGAAGLKRATETAILSANYISHRLSPHFPTLYANAQGRVAHECILDLRGFKATTGISAEDVAKRLMDYGFHAPTLSFPVPGTLMVEPTESEPLEEIERFIQAMIAIREEIARVESGEWPQDLNPLKNAPHTSAQVVSSHWPYPYTREAAAFPPGVTAAHKYWPPVARVDNVYGDRNLFCSCIPVTEAAEADALAPTA